MEEFISLIFLELAKREKTAVQPATISGLGHQNDPGDWNHQAFSISLLENAGKLL
jgi:hypothetical protein